MPAFPGISAVSTGPRGMELRMSRLNSALLGGSVAAMMMLAPAVASAQEVVTVAGVEATRVVIAPPRSELARIIKSGLAAAYFAAEKGSRAYDQAQKLYYFYGARHFEPLWLSTDDAGKVVLSSKAESILDVFKTAEREGFRPADYLTPDLDVAAAGTDPTKLAALETAWNAPAG